MKIVFLSRYPNPDDVSIWSGTLSHMYHSLKKRHQVVCLGGEMLKQASTFQVGNLPGKYMDQERYIVVFGQLLSERIHKLKADVVFFGDNYYVPYLTCNIPVVRISDVTFEQFKNYLDLTDEKKINSGIETERLALNNYTRTIYSSEWIKQKTVEYYGIDPATIDVVEFGANIPTPDSYSEAIDITVCHLVFIGKVWKKKGGDKVLEAYRKLKAEGFRCTLTVIGSVPDTPREADDDLTVFPFLDKAKPEDLNTLCSILARSHLLVLPTQYDAFGIVFCEASAYGVPSIAADVCGVSQPVREGKNGYLLPPEATAGDYAEKIKAVFGDTENYLKLRAASRREFETRLNWHVWGERVDQILEETVRGYKEKKTTEEIKTGI